MAEELPEGAAPATVRRTWRAPAEIGNQLSPEDVNALLQLADAVRELPGKAPAVAAAPAEDAAPSKGHRFQRQAASLVSANTPPAPSPAQPSGRGPAAKASILRQHPILVWIVVQFCGLGLLLAGLLLGEWDASFAKPVPPKSLPPTGSPPAAKTPLAVPSAGEVDAALRAASLAMTHLDAGDLRAARSTLETLAGRPAAAPGAEYQLALLDVRRGDPAAAEQHLARSLAAGQAVAPCCYLRAARAGLAGDYPQAAAQLRLAVQAEPFNGRYWFYWGEALRRAGQPREAAIALQAALARPLTTDEWQLYAFKMHLAEVEDGPGNPFAAELEAKLAQGSPSGDWLLLDAAQSLQHQGFITAAQCLRDASRQLPPPVYRTWVSDYAFQEFRGRVELERYLLVPPPALTLGGVLLPLGASPPAAALPPSPTALTIAPVTAPESTPPPAVPGVPDPTVCPAAEADPGVWPSVVAK